MVIIMNMFITFGDILLPNSVDYDDLFYEMIRCRGDLLKFYEAGTSVIMDALSILLTSYSRAPWPE